MCRPYVDLKKQIIYDSHIQMLTKVRHGVSILSEDLGDKSSIISEQLIFLYLGMFFTVARSGGFELPTPCLEGISAK